MNQISFDTLTCLQSLEEKFFAVETKKGLAFFSTEDQNKLKCIHHAYLAKREYFEKVRGLQEILVTSLRADKAELTEYSLSDFDVNYETRVEQRQFVDLNVSFVNSCIAYIEKSHKIKVDAPMSEEYERDKETPKHPAGHAIDLDELAEKIHTALGGLDFEEKWKQETINKLQYVLRGSKSTLKSKTVILDIGRCLYETWGFKDSKYSMRNDDRAVAIERAVQLFDGLPTGKTYNLFERGWEIIDPFVTQAPCWSKSVESVRPYKSGRVDIKFKDIKLAMSFCSVFQIKTDDKQQAS